MPLEKAKDLVRAGLVVIEGISPNGVINVSVVNNYSSGSCFTAITKGTVK